MTGGLPDKESALSRPMAVESLAERLKTEILNGRFAPGEFLRDIKMAEQYDVGRATFRSAAQLLVSTGLLRREANRGFFVPLFSADDIYDVTRFRGILEGEAVKVIVDTGLIPAAALAAVETLRQSGPETSRAQLVTADRDFHRAIVAAAGSARLQHSYDIIESEIELLLAQQQDLYESPLDIVRDHEHLIACLRTRDFRTARNAFVEHWDDLREKILNAEAARLMSGKK
jgi:DNA-binding GntR family transcriptional regulator